MKIDIHVHTKKAKTGDAETRNIEPVKFSEIIKNTEVGIIAVTNHNLFDISQFTSLAEVVKESCQVWPGIELDILEADQRAHLIVIVSPTRAEAFSEKVNELMTNKTPDNFSISIGDTVQAFDALDPIYIAHYHSKRPNLRDSELGLLSSLVANPKRILKEASNAISAGIYISHGHNSIYGSDIQDWDQYANLSKKLPELRLPVESFEQFCLLLEKDQATIDTILDKKSKELITIHPFGIAETISLDIYNDINVLFGSKGTGKTEILDSISKYFNDKGYKTRVYKSNEKTLDEVFDIKNNTLSVIPEDCKFDDCASEIQFLKSVTEEEITSITKYYNHFSVQETNRLAQKLKIKDIHLEDQAQPYREFEDVKDVYQEVGEFKQRITGSEKLGEYVDQDLINDAVSALEKILGKLRVQTVDRFLAAKNISLLNHIVENFSHEVSKKTGRPQKPIKTGFADYSSNRIKIEIAARKILDTVETNIPAYKEYAGSLGVKGDLYCVTQLRFETGDASDSNFTSLQGIKKIPQKSFVKTVSSISRRIYNRDLFEKVAELNDIDGIETIITLKNLLQIKRTFQLNETKYQPSSGESSMILLHRELKEDKEIYLIDEPERSLGNDYINEVIVPLIKEKAILGKKVIIATHDANIAVRTLPYNSIYRWHNAGRYYTLTGNPFLNKLRCINRSTADLNWKEISMKTLEGGRDAFGERGRIYGN